MLKLAIGLLSFAGLVLCHQDPTKIHAVLISAITCDEACSISYPVESEIARAYHLLINQGVPAKNIIVFHRDDATNNTEWNPYPGTLYDNRDLKVDYRKGLKIDYTGDDVTVENVLAVLQGEKDKVRGGNGKVLESTEEDRLFFFHGGHGGDGILEFPHEALMTAKQYNDALKNMQNKKMYKELVFYLLACHSGSIFEGQLEDNQNIWAFTAASPDDSAYGKDCNDFKFHGQKYFLCFNTEYGYGWLTDSEKSNPENETLETQFERVKKFVKQNVVNRYGNAKITKETVGNYQGVRNESFAESFEIKEIDNESSLPISRFAAYLIVKRKLALSNNFDEQQKLKLKLEQMEQEQKDIKQIAKNIVSALLPQKFIQFNQILNQSPHQISQLECHHVVMQEVSKKCKKIVKSPFVNNFITPMANLCEQGVQASAIIDQLNKQCKF